MIKYSEKFDAMFDSVKDVWTESKCSDANCEFCPERPEKPSQVEE